MRGDSGHELPWTPSLAALVGIPLAAVLAPLLATGRRRCIRIPLVVFEIVLGPAVRPVDPGLGATDRLHSSPSPTSAWRCCSSWPATRSTSSGSAAGPLSRSIVGWLISLVAGVPIGILLAPTVTAGVFIGVALTSTALGTLMPMLRDAGELRTPFGTAVIAIGAVGEFGPLIAISIFLSGRNPGLATVVLIAFVLITAGAIYLAAAARITGCTP